MTTAPANGFASIPMLGARPVADGTWFRVWAPASQRVSLAIEERDELPLAREEEGWFKGFAPDVAAGARYRYRLDGGALLPDPCSRFQPDGPHGASAVIDPSAFAWTDAEWRGVQLHGQVIYELHAGTFTPEGTFAVPQNSCPNWHDSASP